MLLCSGFGSGWVSRVWFSRKSQGLDEVFA